MSNYKPDDQGLILNCPQCGQRNRMAYTRLGEAFKCGKCHNALPPPAEPIEMENDAIFASLIAGAALPVLVDFWAPWCGPCKMVAPELVKVASAGSGRWLIVKVNTEQLPGPAQRFRISAIPTLLVFKGGLEVARQSGAMPANAIRQFIEKAI